MNSSENPWECPRPNLEILEVAGQAGPFTLTVFMVHYIHSINNYSFQQFGENARIHSKDIKCQAADFLEYPSWGELEDHWSFCFSKLLYQDVIRNMVNGFKIHL